MIYWNGLQSTTSIVVVARSTINGNCTLQIGAKTDIEAAVTTVNDGLVRLEITGLSPDTTYDYTLTTPDGVGTGSNTTFPTSGRCPIGIMGCQETGSAMVLNGMRRNRIYAAIHLGDESYGENELFGISSGAPYTFERFEDQDLHYEFKRVFRTNPDKIENIREMGFCWVEDDHDWGINDVADPDTWDADPVANPNRIQADQDGTLGWDYITPDEASWNLVKASSAAATKAYSLGNPINTDSDSHGSGDGSARYFRFEAGDVEYFVLAPVQISDDEMRGQSELALQTHALLGDDGIQGAWLKAHLASSSKPFKCVCSPKGTLFNQDINNESWRAYNDLYPLLQAIHDDSAIKGVMFMCQDHHIPGAYCSKAGSYGVLNYTDPNTLLESGFGQVPPITTVYDFDHVSLLCSPNGKADNMRNSDINDTGPKVTKAATAVTYANAGTLFHIDQTTNPELQNVQGSRFRDPNFFVFGVVDTTSAGNLIGKIVSLNDGESLFEAEVAPGTNFVVGT